MYLCLCHALSERKIKRLIKDRGCGSLQALQRECRAGQSCGSCVLRLKNYLSGIKSNLLPIKNSEVYDLSEDLIAQKALK